MDNQHFLACIYNLRDIYWVNSGYIEVNSLSNNSRCHSGRDPAILNMKMFISELNKTVHCVNYKYKTWSKNVHLFMPVKINVDTK